MKDRLEILLVQENQADRKGKIAMDVRRNYFGILIQHPKMCPDKITKCLGLQPSHAATEGDSVVTISGKETGTRHKWSFWSYYENFEEEILKDQACDLIERISSHSDFFNEILEEKGKTFFIIRSSENKHAVCSLSPEALKKLTNLNMTLELEVFKSA